MSSVRWSRVALFYAIAVAGIGAIGLILGGMGSNTSGLVGGLLGGVAMFSPLVASVVCNRLDGNSAFDGLARFRLSRWLVFASLVPLALALTIVLVGVALPGTAWDWEMNAIFDRFAGTLSDAEIVEAKAELAAFPVHPVWLSLPQAVVAGATINALFAFGEEFGWRGWLQRELAPLGFWAGSLLTGVMWGFWHAPLIAVGHNYPTFRLEGVFLFTVVCLFLAPLHSFVRLKAGTVWAAAIFHGTINASAGIAMMVVAGHELVVGVQGVAGVIVLAAANLVLLAVIGLRPVDLEPVEEDAGEPALEAA